MTNPLLVTLCSLATFGSVAFAQQASTSPAGMLTTEGNSQQPYFGPGIDSRWQQLDNSQIGTPRTLRGFALRRDDRAPSTESRRVALDVLIDHADLTNLYAEFDANLSSGAQHAILARKIDIPNWDAATLPGPRPFDCVVPLDQPFTYDGRSALLLDVTHRWIENPSGLTPIMMDLELVPPQIQVATPLASGCTATGRSTPFLHTVQIENQGSAAANFSMRMQITATGAPSGGAAVFNMDFLDRNLGVPGLCARIHAFPERQFSPGPIALDGRLHGYAFSCPYFPYLVGVTFVTQFAALDPGQPALGIALSDAQQVTMPRNHSLLAHECVFHYATLPAVSAPLQFGGGMVFRLDW